MKELQVMIQAIEKAQQAGVYTLQEAAQIIPSIGAVSQALIDASKAQEEPVKEDKKQK